MTDNMQFDDLSLIEDCENLLALANSRETKNIAEVDDLSCIKLTDAQFKAIYTQRYPESAKIVDASVVPSTKKVSKRPKEDEGEGNLHWTPDMQLALARAAHEFKPFLETKNVNGKSKDFKWGEVMSHSKNHPAFKNVKHHKVIRII